MIDKSTRKMLQLKEKYNINDNDPIFFLIEALLEITTDVNRNFDSSLRLQSKFQSISEKEIKQQSINILRLENIIDKLNLRDLQIIDTVIDEVNGSASYLKEQISTAATDINLVEEKSKKIHDMVIKNIINLKTEENEFIKKQIKRVEESLEEHSSKDLMTALIFTSLINLLGTGGLIVYLIFVSAGN